MIGYDPNGYDWDARCRECGRVDQSCKCDWPMPAHQSAEAPPPGGVFATDVAPDPAQTGAPTKTSVGEDDA